MRGRLLIAAGTLAGLAALGYFYTRPQPLSVQTARVERGAVVETVVNTRAGTVKACRRARLAPPLGGQISQLPFKKGDAVRAGQLLLELWNQDLQAQLTVAQHDVLAAASRAEEACVAADLARREANRLTALLDRGLVAVDAADRAKGDAESRAAACRAATQNINVTQARVSQAQAGLERTRLRAPFDGILAEINGEIGEFVTPSPLGVATPPAVDVVDTSCIYVTAPIDEVDAPRIRVDMQARVTLDAFRNRTFAACVQRLLESLSLADRARHRPNELSGGQRQRVAIARAMVMEPAVLLADEPTGNLDHASGAEVLREIEALNAGGITLLVVTHDAEVAARARRHLRMRDGRVVEDSVAGPSTRSGSSTYPG